MCSQVMSMVKFIGESYTEDVEQGTSSSSEVESSSLHKETMFNQRRNSDIINLSENLAQAENKIIWKFQRQFQKVNGALIFLQREICWSFARQCFDKDGLKNYYKCNHFIEGGPQCPKQIYFLFHEFSGTVLMYRTFEKHIHPRVLIPNYQLSDAVKQEINILNDLNLQPEDIRQQLKKNKQVKTPKGKQIKAYLRTVGKNMKSKNRYYNLNIENSETYKENIISKSYVPLRIIEDVEKEPLNIKEENFDLTLTQKIKEEPVKSSEESDSSDDESKNKIPKFVEGDVELKSCKTMKRSGENITEENIPKIKRSKSMENVDSNDKTFLHDNTHVSQEYRNMTLSVNENSQLEKIKKEEPTEVEDTVWAFDRMFQDIQSAFDYMTERTSEWKFSHQQLEKDGERKYYKCKENVEPACPAQVYLFLDNLSSSVFIYQAVCGHNHCSKVSGGDISAADLDTFNQGLGLEVDEKTVTENRSSDTDLINQTINDHKSINTDQSDKAQQEDVIKFSQDHIQKLATIKKHNDNPSINNVSITSTSLKPSVEILTCQKPLNNNQGRTETKSRDRLFEILYKTRM